MEFDAFLDLYDHTGKVLEAESIDKQHPKMLQVTEFGFAVTHPVDAGVGTGMASGKTVFEDLEVTLLQSKASPTLFQWACTGEHLQKGILYVRKAGSTQQDYMIVHLADCFVTKVSVKAAGGAGAMTETVTFATTAIQYEYHQQDEKGQVSKTAHKGGFHLKKNDVFTV